MFKTLLHKLVMDKIPMDELDLFSFAKKVDELEGDRR